MIGYFPIRYNDELLYSIIARYHVHTGIMSYKTTISELFGKSTMRAVIDFPGNLQGLVKNLPFNKLTSEMIIKENTMFPIYQPFLPEERANIIKRKLENGDNTHIHAQVGITSSRISNPGHLVYCPHCYQEELDKYGEPYWHRIHQVPGVLVCPHHGCILTKSKVILPLSSQHEYIASFNAVDDLSDLNIMYTVGIQDELFKIANDLYWIINSNLSSKPFNYYREKYLSALIKKNLATPAGRIRQKDFVSDFISYYTPEILTVLGCYCNPDHESNWIREIVRKHRKMFHPLYHVLMMRFLFGSAENFFKESTSLQVFGNGPWCCLNPAADHFMENCVKVVTYSLNYKTKKITGKFHCTCGYIYSRNYEEGTNEKQDIGKKCRVIEFGPIWIKTMERMVKEGKSLTSISKELRTDIRTIEKRLKLLEVKQNVTDSIIEVDKRKQDGELLSFKRELWKKLREENPDLTKTELRAKVKGLYTWLYRHDRDWLNHNSPRTERKGLLNNNRINWEKRDKELLVV